MEQKKIEKIKWLPEIEGEFITITFDLNNIPFSDPSWKTGTKTDTSLTGKLKTLCPAYTDSSTSQRVGKDAGVVARIRN